MVISTGLVGTQCSPFSLADSLLISNLEREREKGCKERRKGRKYKKYK